MQLIEPNWPAPEHVRAYSTTRFGGESSGAYAGLNLGLHVGDDVDRVMDNRCALERQLGLSLDGCWLNQTHSTHLKCLPMEQGDEPADAAWTEEVGVPCIAMTADCLPLLVTDRLGTKVAAIHAGWRGLCEGVIEKALDAFEDKSQVLVWLGPAIGQSAFEVGEDVKSAFVSRFEDDVDAFLPSRHSSGKYYADLYKLARRRLNRIGVEAIYGGEFCTYSDSERFYSYRRDGVTGRQATIIWLASS